MSQSLHSPSLHSKMSSTPSKNSTATENALKGKVKYYHTVADRNGDRADNMELWFVRSLVASRNEELLRDYVSHHDVWKTVKSDSLNITTVIKPYTNKQGVTFNVHFSIHGHYLEKCSKWGDAPVAYTGNFNISQYIDLFEINWCPNATTIADLWVVHHELRDDLLA